MDSVSNPVDQMEVTVKSPELIQEQFRFAPKVDGRKLVYALVHQRGPLDAPPCGGVAFWYTIQPMKGATMDPNCVRFNDGTYPIEGAAFLCDTCKQPLSMNGLEIYARMVNEKKRKARKQQRAARKRSRRG